MVGPASGAVGPMVTAATLRPSRWSPSGINGSARSMIAKSTKGRSYAIELLSTAL